MRMLQKMMNTDLLLKEINDVFPDSPMPDTSELTVHQKDCELCDDVRRYLNVYRHLSVDNKLIRFLHQNLYELSPLAFRWVLPHYLKYCLTEDWAYAQEETYFLVFNLGPAPQLENDTLIRFAALNDKQINCLIDFLSWCTGVEDCIDIEDDINRAFAFLKKLLNQARLKM
ncbi:DUF6714 family protein [Aquirhabdus parva]|uniref:Uncharacterized protein n=1 Tax=Aquirhabdus parva TaxID=2283318 RepID=A0A345PAM3_9GAMM|nr:DUF6714 family protein [Aquirhabdus parva]AXI04332.1 hypothetical protein HYN46_16705 [Aquirhabdus parva]